MTDETPIATTTTATDELPGILEELYELSENKDLFYQLLNRASSPQNDENNDDGDDDKGKTSSSRDAETSAFVKRIRQGFDKFIKATSKEEATEIFYPELTRAYEKETREVVLNYQEILLGECILLYTCLVDREADDTEENTTPQQEEEEQYEPCREALLDEIIRRIEMSEFGTRAAREWITLMIQYLELQEMKQGTNNDESALQNKIHMMKEQRASLTCSLFQNRPGLVGEAIVGLGLSAEQMGDMIMAKKCFQGVVMDLDYVGKKMPPSLRWELIAIHYWFEQACKGLLRLSSEADESMQSKLEQVQNHRSEKGMPDAPSMPQVGPIAATYLAPTPYLARLLQELQEVGDGMELFDMAHRYDYCHKMDFFVSAMGSFYSARPLLKSMGVHTSYDVAHQEVFDALNYIKQQQEQGEETTT